MANVWRKLLEETDRQAKARLQAADIYADRIAEPIKGVKAAKVQCTKKVIFVCICMCFRGGCGVGRF